MSASRWAYLAAGNPEKNKTQEGWGHDIIEPRARINPKTTHPKKNQGDKVTETMKS